MRKFGTAVILAGGKSKRMGRNKELLNINNRRLVEMQISKLERDFEEIIVITNYPQYYHGLNCKTFTDIIKNKGPIGGIYAGLVNSSSLHTYFLACDMPVINRDYIMFLKSMLKKKKHKACITLLGEWIEPFNAFYSKDMTEDVKKYIDKGGYKIYDLVKKIDVLFIEEKTARKYSPTWDMFINFNTKEDIESFLKENEMEI
ncbi:MAG: molybdenum cofactor guanylyltransferase [Bacillota bacterium]|nr:molybdenum cofactor guanylyltransferase [Bacillota bacterium]